MRLLRLYQSNTLCYRVKLVPVEMALLDNCQFVRFYFTVTRYNSG